MGHKNYELNNHLGNVLVTISDRKYGYETGVANGIAEYYKVDITTVSDYYAFGMLNMQRQYEANRYRHGFNGQEKGDEIYANENLYTATFWEYDARLARRWNIDPIYKHYISNYSVLGLNPILNIDPNGDDFL